MSALAGMLPHPDQVDFSVKSAILNKTSLSGRFMRLTTARDFGKLIRAVRRKTKLTQAQLAAASGTGERFIRELEKGKATYQLEKALFVAQMLGIKFNANPPPQIDWVNMMKQNQLSIRLYGEPVGILE